MPSTVSDKDVLFLIRGHYEENEVLFKETSLRIAEMFLDDGKEDLSDYVMALIHPEFCFIPMAEGEVE